jgi:hypothetical protein
VAAALGAFLGDIFRGEQLATVFLGRAHIHQRQVRAGQALQVYFSFREDHPSDFL